MDKVISPDGTQVSITAIDHNFQPRIRQLESGCEGDGPTMGCVERIKIQVSCYSPGATDTGYNGDFVKVQAACLQRMSEAIYGGSYAASRTPDVRHAVHSQERLYRIRRNGLFDLIEFFGHQLCFPQ
jgi:hypothetical protein